MKDTLPVKYAPSWWSVGFLWRDFPHNSLLSFYVNLLKSILWLLFRNKINVCHLNSCVNGRLYLSRFCTIVPEYSSAITRTFALNSVILVAISHELVQLTWRVIKLLAISLVAMEGYSSKFTIFTGATPSTKMQIWLRSISNKVHLHFK